MNAETKRIADGLAAGKVFYLRGGKKLKGNQGGGPATASPVPSVAPKGDTESAPDKFNKGKDK